MRLYSVEILLIFYFICCCLSQNETVTTWTYRAAVYEHRPSFPVLSRTGWQSIEDNLNIYEDQIRLAAEKGARLIVFPEDGIFGMNMNRTTIYQYLEIVSDPQQSIVNPCLDAIPTARNRIQRRLSCAARWYQMYVVANFGTVEFCNDKTSCPQDGRFQFNTNVVFDSDGAIVSRYHKQNLFYEEQFNVPPKVNYAVFGSPLGSFGTFTCFDILFKEPALSLIESVGVVNIAFPTAWTNIMPEMFTLAIHEGWAIRMGVNLLSAEIHFPEVDMQGSAIYSSQDGALIYYNNNEFLSGGKLLITNVTTPPKGPPEGKVNMPHSKEDMKANFTSIMESNPFTFVALDQNKLSDEIYLTYSDTKCYLSYKKQRNDSEIYAFGIFEGLHQSALNSYIQVCALVRCANLSYNSCGKPTKDAFTVFDNMTLSGQFSTDYIFPSLLVNGANPSKQNWDFLLDKEELRGQMSFTDLKKPLLSSILYTRVYDKDNNKNNVNTYQSVMNQNGPRFNWHAKTVTNDRNSYSYMFLGFTIGIICIVILVAVVKMNMHKRKPGYIKL